MNSDKCVVRAVASGKESEAEVLSFHEKRNLTVALNKSVKLSMTWNGRMFEGKVAGMDFESNGPKIIADYNYTRGKR